jgi:hypothetical protein
MPRRNASVSAAVGVSKICSVHEGIADGVDRPDQVAAVAGGESLILSDHLFSCLSLWLSKSRLHSGLQLLALCSELHS